MNENIKKYIAIISAIIVVFCTLYSCGKIVKAEVPASQLVVGHSDSWGSYDFTYVFHSKYYTIQDSTGIPTSTLLNPQYFYTNDNVTFDSVSGTDLVMLVLNRGIGLILDPDNISVFCQAFFNAIGPNHLNTNGSKYVQGGLYDSNDNFLGYCLDDISGCYWQGNQLRDTYTIPAQTKDNIKNFTDYYTDGNFPDFFTIYPVSNNFIKNQFYADKLSTHFTYFSTKIEDFSLCSPVYIADSHGNANTHTSFTSDAYLGDRLNFNGFVEETQYLVMEDNYLANWNGLCRLFGISNNDTNVVATDYPNFNANATQEIKSRFDAYNIYDQRITQMLKVNLNDERLDSTNQDYIEIGTSLNFWNDYNVCLPFNVEQITVYKNSGIKTSLDNNLYYPQSYTTDQYNNYDSSPMQVTLTQTDNSVQYNNQIFNDSNDNYYNYYDNGVYDSSSSVTNITNITNNYYENNGGGGDNPDDPDDPDSPVLDEILRAILRFFNAIGDIIGTLLASIINLIDSVLEALAGVMENLTGMSDFFSSLFAWLPDPVPQVLGAGFGICLVCGIIKFIRG